jgi:hypothetical protein
MPLRILHATCHSQVIFWLVAKLESSTLAQKLPKKCPLFPNPCVVGFPNDERGYRRHENIMIDASANRKSAKALRTANLI